MAETVDKRTIINDALAMLGSAPIGSLTEETSKCDKCLRAYNLLIPACLGLWDWSFNRDAYPLDLLNETPVNGWKYAFGMPGGVVGAPVKVLTNPARPDDPLRDFTLEGGKLYANVKPLSAIFPVDVNPSVWLPPFRRAVTTGLAGDLAVPIREDKSLGEQLNVKAFGTEQMLMRGGLMGIALSADAARSRRSAPQWRDPLTEARFS